MNSRMGLIAVILLQGAGLISMGYRQLTRPEPAFRIEDVKIETGEFTPDFIQLPGYWCGRIDNYKPLRLELKDPH